MHEETVKAAEAKPGITEESKTPEVVPVAEEVEKKKQTLEISGTLVVKIPAKIVPEKLEKMEAYFEQAIANAHKKLKATNVKVTAKAESSEAPFVITVDD